MATRNVTAIRSRSRALARPDSPDTWPVIWRVVAPGAGGYNHDTVYLETPSERDAQHAHRQLLQSRYPVRLERVHCGPLPTGAERSLATMRKQNPQNSGDEPRPILGKWEARS